MSRNRPYTDFPRNEQGLVDNFIGTAYDTVKRVYDNLPEIQRLDDVLEEIPTLAQASVDNALAVAMPPILAQLDEKVQVAEGWAGEAEASAEAAAQSSLAATKVNMMFPFTSDVSQMIYDVTVISGQTDVNTAGMALWVEGAIEFDFTILSATTFMLNDATAYPHNAQMRIILNAHFNDLVHGFDQLLGALEQEYKDAAALNGRWCGVHVVPPTTRLDGSPLQDADEYQNRSDKLRYSWNGSTWVALNSSAQQLEARLADPLVGAKIVQYTNPGLTGIAGAEYVDVNKKLTESVSLYDFGAKGGGVDDSTPLYDALSWLYGGSNRSLNIPQGGEFRAPQKVLIPINKLVRNCHLTAYGSTLLFEAAGGIKVHAIGTGLLSELTVKGLRTNGGVRAVEFEANDDMNFIYNMKLEDLDLAAFSESGLILSGNVFESSITDLSAGSLQATGYCIHLLNVGDGIVSSVDVWGGNTRGGKHGLFVENPVSDVGVYGGTYLQAQNEGVRIDNAIGATVFRTHVEHNWRSAGSLAAGGAGLHMSGRGTIIGVVGQNSPTTFQQYVVSVYANDIQIIGGGAGGTYTKYGRYQQPSDGGGNLTIIGDAPASYDAINEVFPVLVGKLSKSVKLAKTENYRNYSATINVNLNRGNFLRVGELTGNVAIGNPTNRAGVNGEELTIALTQDRFGLHTVTWGDAFAVPVSPIDTTAYKVSIWTFIWTGTKWRQTSFSASL